MSYADRYGILYGMKAQKKITANLPKDLLQRAMQASGEGLTPTLRRGLELIAAQQVYRKLLKAKGKYRAGVGSTASQLKKERE